MKPQNISFKHLFKDVRRKSILQTILFSSSRLQENKKIWVKLLKATLKIFPKRKWIFYVCVFIIFSKKLS